jgi:hypothetical protein
MVLGLQSGKLWAEVESKLYPVSYSGTSIKTMFASSTIFPKNSASAPAPTPTPALASAPAPAPTPASILGQTEVPSGYVLAPELDTFECDYETSESDDRHPNPTTAHTKKRCPASPKHIANSKGKRRDRSQRWKSWICTGAMLRLSRRCWKKRSFQ